MTINKTEQFIYFQNKAKHYDTIRNIKSSVDDKLQQRYMKTLSFSQRQKQQKFPQKKKHNRLVPLMKEIQIKQQNQKMINRLVKMFKSQRTQVNIQGNYSRFNRQQRKFRSTNPYQDQLNRTIQIGNTQLQQRLKRTKPKIGNSIQWNRHFGKTLSLKKNMSRYLLQSNKSKASLHISVVDNYVPKYFQTFLNTSSVIDLDKNKNRQFPKQIQITQQGLLMLPDIKSKQAHHPTHLVRQTKDNRKLIFDRSRSTLNDNHNKSQSSLESYKNIQNPQKKQNSNQNNQKTSKHRLLQFKFSQMESSINQHKNIKKEKEKKQLKGSQPQSTLVYQNQNFEKQENQKSTVQA